jgi:cytochrome c oxidase subunit 1/cytochrome c oxidase subunit I+III
VHDSYFVVAHFHYVLNGAVVFPIFGALYFWLPKMTGRMLSERIGKVSFWTMFVGFNLAFFPMHILGFLGMPRRIYTYKAGLGWEGLNLVSTIGGFLFGFGTLLTLIAIIKARINGAPAGNNPWDADSLEWATTSPPPDYNFLAIPVVESRHPLWDQVPLPVGASGEDAATRSYGPPGALDRETPITAGLESAPEESMVIPTETYLPLVLAVGIAALFVALLVKAVLVLVFGVALATVAMVMWTWRTEEDLV